MLRPVFQVELRTGDISLAAIAAVVVDIAVLMLLPADGLLAASLAHLAAMGVGLALVLRRAIAGRLVDWPLRDIAKIAVGSLLLVACVTPLSFEGHEFLTLVARAAAGFRSTPATVWLLDVAGLRAFVKGRIQVRRERRSEVKQGGAPGASPI